MRTTCFQALWAALALCLTVTTGCHKYQDIQPDANAVAPATNQPPVAETAGKSSNAHSLAEVAPAPAAPPQAAPMANSQPQMPPGLPGTLPEFKTYLVGLTTESRVNIDSIPELTAVCAELQHQLSLSEMNGVMECRMRQDHPLSAEASPTSAVVSFSMQDAGMNGQAGPGMNLTFDGWHSLVTPAATMAVMDFTSPGSKFFPFRVVSLRPGITTEPMPMSKTLLRADQGSMAASFDRDFAGHLARITCQGGFLELRPFIRAMVGPPLDMVDSLAPVYRPLAFGNELGFTRLRETINAAMKEKLDKKKELDRPADAGYYASRAGVRFLPPEVQTEIAAIQVDRAALAASIAADRASLAVIPESMSDSKLSHVALMFMAGTPLTAGERFELIRFMDTEGLEGGK